MCIKASEIVVNQEFYEMQIEDHSTVDLQAIINATKTLIDLGFDIGADLYEETRIELEKRGYK